MSVSIEGNGKPTFRMSLPTAGAISSIVGVLIFSGGFFIGYQTFKSEMALISQSVDGLKKQTSSIGVRVNLLNETVATDRQTQTNALTVMQTDIKYITQGIAELKLRAGTNR